MNHIKKLTIEGFKKFEHIEVDFNEHMNILVGENEAGKSTILEAIKIVLNQQYRNSDKAILRNLLNKKMIEKFKRSPCVENLPKILIEVELELDPYQKKSNDFYGEGYKSCEHQIEKFGIRFECRFNLDFEFELDEFISSGKIPYEYYSLIWETFANQQYSKSPINFVYVNTTGSRSYNSFNYYSKMMFNSYFDDFDRMEYKSLFCDKLEDILNELQIPELPDNRRFGIDIRKFVLEDSLLIFDDSISLDNKGSGMENLIKTKIALDKKSKLDLVLIEEPENHLSFSTLNKMLDEIDVHQKNAQLIITTHSSMIASRLNLKNVLWIAQNKVESLKSIDDETANFFVKADDNSFLQLLLSKKVILVEGTTEFLLLPYFYQKQYKKSIEEDEITIISCNGTTYKRYLDIAKSINKKIAVITDNDGSEEKILAVNKFNEKCKNIYQKIFVPNNIESWTWEKCIYDLNQAAFNELLNVKSNCKHLYHGKSVDSNLWKMLNSKAETAYKMIKSDKDFKVPDYVNEAFEWLRE